MKKNSSEFKLILASRSPRRIEILKQAGLEFRIIASNSSERFHKNLSLHANLRQISRNKGIQVLNSLRSQNDRKIIILSADTIVVRQGKVLGKPNNAMHARRMLRFLSGKVHLVKTAFTIICAESNEEITRIVTTRVGFRQISESEIDSYVRSGEPFDKAGSYAIQGLGRKFIRSVKGDLLNVVGLPFDSVVAELKRKKWRLKKSQRKNRRRSRPH